MGDSPSRRQAAMRYGHRNDAGIPVQLKVSGGTAEASFGRGGLGTFSGPVPGSRKKTEQERIPYIVYIALGGRFFC